MKDHEVGSIRINFSTCTAFFGYFSKGITCTNLLEHFFTRVECYIAMPVGSSVPFATFFREKFKEQQNVKVDWQVDHTMTKGRRGRK